MLTQSHIRRQERTTGLIDVALVICVLGLVYLSLRPWVGWRTPSHSLLRFLSDPWTRYWTWDDVVSNLLGYLPLGMLLAMRLRRALRGPSILLAALLAGGLLSFALETLQNFLPRVPSLLDLALNTLGTGIGAMVALLFMQRPNDGRELKWHRPAFASRSAIAFLAIVALWVLAQLTPQRMMFETGSIVSPGLSTLSALGAAAPSANNPAAEMATGLARFLAGLQAGTNYAMLIESLSVAVSMCIVGLLLLDVVLAPRWRLLAVTLTIATGLMARFVSQAAIGGGAETSQWLTAGAQAGLLIGPIGLILLSGTTRRARLVWLLLLLTVGFVLTNLMPDSVYRSARSAAQAPEWSRNLLATLQTVAALWPLAAALVVARQLVLHRQRWDGIPFMGSDVSVHLRPIREVIRHAQ